MDTFNSGTVYGEGRLYRLHSEDDGKLRLEILRDQVATMVAKGLDTAVRDELARLGWLSPDEAAHLRARLRDAELALKGTWEGSV